MNRLTRHVSQKFNGLTRTVICVEHEGADAVVLSSEFDLQNRLLRQVRYEHQRGCLVNSFFTEFRSDGKVAEQWVFLYDDAGEVVETYGFDEFGNPIGEYGFEDSMAVSRMGATSMATRVV